MKYEKLYQVPSRCKGWESTSVYLIHIKYKLIFASNRKMNSISTTDRRAMPSFDFAEQGFSNIIILNEKKKIILRTNAGTMEKAMAWKDVYCQRYDYHFTCKKSHKAVITRFHGVFQCLYGDRQYQESNKIYTK